MNTNIKEIVDKTNLLQSYQSEEGTIINVENYDIVRTILCDIVKNIKELNDEFISSEYKNALISDINIYIESKYQNLCFDNSVMALKKVENLSKFFFWGPLRLANGLRQGWKFETFLSIREEPMEKEFDIMYKTYSHPKNICQSSKLLIGSKGVELGNNIVFFPENVKSNVKFKKQSCAVFFFDKFYDIYNTITLPLIDKIGLGDLASSSRNIDRNVTYNARCVWGYLHDYYHHQGVLPFDEHIQLKTNWYVGVLEEIKVDAQTLLALSMDFTLPYRKVTFEFVLLDRVFRYTQEVNIYRNFDSATSFFIIQYLLNHDVILIKNGKLGINLPKMIEELKVLVKEIQDIEGKFNNDEVTFKDQCKKYFFKTLDTPIIPGNYYAISSQLSLNLAQVGIL
jgi:hypothetical protein BATR1942_17670